jgi:SAM-dependent methyltransferase
MTHDGFDGLAQAYDTARPRYPGPVFDWILAQIDRPGPWSVLDAGAGPGIALETLAPRLPVGSRITACDQSADMVDLGRAKFPQVSWVLDQAETVLESLADLTLIVAAQAYQWMDRPRFLAAARAGLAPGGGLAIVQNNRDYTAGGLTGAYEDLLERYSPGYRRDYRAFDIADELSGTFPSVRVHRLAWTQVMGVDQFLTLSHSSTQARRARDAHPDVFSSRVADLAQQWAEAGVIRLPYTCEAFVGLVAPAGAAPAGSR